MKKYALKLIVASVLAVTASSATAADMNVTRGATAMTSNLATRSGYGVDNLIDQVGLNNTYVNGVTEFETFTASARHFSSTTPSTGFANNWLGNLSSPTVPALNFDLGASYDINGLAFFNLATTAGARVTSFKVYVDNDNDASNGYGANIFTSGTFGNAASSSGTDIAPNVFSFLNTTNTRYIVLELLSRDSSPITIGAGEVVFSQAISNTMPVPEPETYAMFLAGLGLFGFAKRRKQA